MGRPLHRPAPLNHATTIAPMRLATIDIGTNTAQLLVAERDGAGLRRLHVAE